MKAAPAAPPARRRLLLLMMLAAAGAGGAYAAWSRSSGDPEALWRRAQDEYNEKHADRAGVLLERLDRLRPPGPEQAFLKAQVAWTRGRLDEAVRLLGSIPDGDRLAPLARLREGQIERERNRIRYAEAAFLRALRLDPKLAQAYRELIYIYGIQMRRAAVRAQFIALSKVAPLGFHDAFMLCLTRGVAWESVEAGAILKGFLAADPDDRYSRLALAETLGRASRHAEAEAVLAPLPDSDPDARAARAEAAFGAGDLGRVEALVAGGPADHPGLAHLRTRLALSRGDWPAAIRQARIMLAADPTLRDGYRSLGQALAAAGDLDAARPYLDVARAHDRITTMVQHAATAGASDDPGFAREFGDTLRAARLYPDARIWYQLAVARDPLDTQAQRSLYDLDAAERADPFLHTPAADAAPGPAPPPAPR